LFIGGIGKGKEVKVMTQEIKEIVDKVPAEMRWNIATQASTSTAIALDGAIQDALGQEKRKEILMRLYAASASGIKQVTDALGLPGDNAETAAKAVTSANTVFFGPEIQAEFPEASPQKVEARATGCPFPLRMKELGISLDCYPVCAAYHEAAYKAVNPKLKVSRGDKCLNYGDSYCDWIVEM
jgi:hypothetical protein